MNVLEYLKEFYALFNGEKGTIGYSENGLPIYYFSVRKTEYPIIIVQYAIHAREYVTTYLAIEQIKEYEKIATHGTVYFIPAMNPDGIMIALNKDKLYKANARGVDLNVNFDARWGSGKENVKINGAMNCIGEYPFSEKETIALKDFTLKIMPNMTVSYHSKGEEIYYEFFQGELEKEMDYRLAKVVQEITNYKIKSTPDSAGGYKDWCIETLKIPALTIEVGDDRLTHPIKKRSLNKIFKKNSGVINALINALSGL